MTHSGHPAVAQRAHLRRKCGARFDGRPILGNPCDWGAFLSHSFDPRAFASPILASPAFLTTRAFSWAAMSTAVEYLFATNLHIADRAARKRGWHAHGRSGWIKPDGNEVHFICFPEQVAAISRDTMIYVVGSLPPQLERLRRKWTLIHT
jgi:predicted amidohydrolase